MAAVVTVLQIEFKTRTGTQFHDGRRIDGNTETVFNAAHHRAGEFAGHGSRAAGRVSPFGPVFQRNEAETHVLTRTGKAEAGHAEEAFHFWHFGDDCIGSGQSRIGTLFGRTRRKLDHHHQAALVFLRQEGIRDVFV